MLVIEVGFFVHFEYKTDSDDVSINFQFEITESEFLEPIHFVFLLITISSK